MVNLYGRTRSLTALEINRFTRIRVVKRATYYRATIRRTEFHVGEITRQNILAHIATVTIRIRSAESKIVAIVARFCAAIVHGEFFERFSSRSSGRILTGRFANGRAEFRRNPADNNTQHDRCNHDQAN